MDRPRLSSVDRTEMDRYRGLNDMKAAVHRVPILKPVRRKVLRRDVGAVRGRLDHERSGSICRGQELQAAHSRSFNPVCRISGQYGPTGQHAKPEPTRPNAIEAGLDAKQLLRKELPELLMDWFATLGHRFDRARPAAIDDRSLDRGPLRAPI